jgi:anaerobic dimethyl sulfoxide reductase subunit C
MNDNFTSLVFFTVLCQTAVGALIFRALILFNGGQNLVTFNFGRISLFAIAILLFISLGIAFFHLGKPAHALSALNNLGKSWLSRELLTFSLLSATILTYFILTTRGTSEKTEIIFSAFSILAGISLMYCMIRLYMIPSTSWYNPFTPVSFTITTFVCGAAMIAVIIGKINNGFSSMVLPLLTIFIIFSLINSILFPGSFFEQNLNFFRVRTALSVLSLLILAMIFFSTQANKIFILWVILFMIVLSSEIINRYIFFLSFEKSGL